MTAETTRFNIGLCPTPPGERWPARAKGKMSAIQAKEKSKMTTTDWLLLAQTAVLFLSGVAVLWYTYETHRIRKETSVQNSLLAEQLAELQRSREYEREKEVSFIQPIFKPLGGGMSPGKGELKFINLGGTARSLFIEIQNPYGATISPRQAIGPNENGKIAFRGLPLPVPQGVSFTIHYTDKLSVRRKQVFDLTGKEGGWVERGGG